MMSSLQGIRFPGKYIQGTNAVAILGDECAQLGDSTLVILDGHLFDALAPRLRQSFAEPDTVTFEPHHGKASEKEVNRLVAVAREAGAEVVVGSGGGKCLDTAKAVAHQLDLPVVIVPTSASSDAPCSALSVIYHDNGQVAYDLFLPRNPDLVIVDTTIIAQAPLRLLVSGIGDALATYYESQACEASGGLNCLSLPGTHLAHGIARMCRDTLFEYGPRAIEEHREGKPGEAFERVVEANILMSGIGFESGGVAAAHGIHHGLCELPETDAAYHGEKVALGVLVETLMHGDEDTYRELEAFNRLVGLPTSLPDVGLVDATVEQLETVAERACRPGEIIHNEPYPVSTALVVKALSRLK